MTKNRKSAADSATLDRLRRRELEIACEPSPENYVKLSDEYRLIGLDKESDRLLQLAEAVEGGARMARSQVPEELLTGAGSGAMLAEMIQIVARMHLTGEFVVEGASDAFRLFFNEGRIINVLSEKFPPGYSSFCQALRVPYGSYHFSPGAVDWVKELIHEKTDVLLILAMQDWDEDTVAHPQP